MPVETRSDGHVPRTRARSTTEPQGWGAGEGILEGCFSPSTPQPEPADATDPSAEPTAGEPDTTAPNSAAAGLSGTAKKVIQPLNAPSDKLRLDELLAKEEAATAAPAAAPVVNGTAASTPAPAQNPGDKVDPNIAAL